MKIPDCGNVEILTGVMGAGKSFYAVLRVLDIIQREQRPVFTNLPLKHKVFRQYLRVKSGPEFASLIYPLSHPHLQRFIERQHARMQVRERIQNHADIEGRPFSMARVEREFEAEHGPEIFEGPEANAIHKAAYIVIDEAHHWYPDKDADTDKELRRYITMLRHHMHNLILITQHPMQMAICTRRLASLFTICTRLDHAKIAGSLTFKNLGVPVLQRKTYSAEDIYNGEIRADAEPLSVEMVYLKSRKNKVIFRLYSSFIHVGSPRKMLAALRETRRLHGVSDRVEILAQQKIQQAKGRTMRIFRRLAKTASFAAALLGVSLIAYTIGQANGKPQEPEHRASLIQVPADLKIRGHAGKRIRIGEDWYAEGDDFYGADVVRVYRDGLVCDIDGRVFAFGRTGLIDLGPADTVVSRARERIGDGIGGVPDGLVDPLRTGPDNPG